MPVYVIMFRPLKGVWRMLTMANTVRLRRFFNLDDAVKIARQICAGPAEAMVIELRTLHPLHVIKKN